MEQTARADRASWDDTPLRFFLQPAILADTSGQGFVAKLDSGRLKVV